MGCATSNPYIQPFDSTVSRSKPFSVNLVSSATTPQGGSLSLLLPHITKPAQSRNASFRSEVKGVQPSRPLSTGLTHNNEKVSSLRFEALASLHLSFSHSNQPAIRDDIFLSDKKDRGNTIDIHSSEHSAVSKTLYSIKDIRGSAFPAEESRHESSLISGSIKRASKGVRRGIMNTPHRPTKREVFVTQYKTLCHSPTAKERSSLERVRGAVSSKSVYNDHLKPSPISQSVIITDPERVQRIRSRMMLNLIPSAKIDDEAEEDHYQKDSLLTDRSQKHLSKSNVQTLNKQPFGIVLSPTHQIRLGYDSQDLSYKNSPLIESGRQEGSTPPPCMKRSGSNPDLFFTDTQDDVDVPLNRKLGIGSNDTRQEIEDSDKQLSDRKESNLAPAQQAIFKITNCRTNLSRFSKVAKTFKCDYFPQKNYTRSKGKNLSLFRQALLNTSTKVQSSQNKSTRVDSSSQQSPQIPQIGIDPKRQRVRINKKGDVINSTPVSMLAPKSKTNTKKKFLSSGKFEISSSPVFSEL